MCDAECRKRFEAIELSINSIANDMKWMRWIVRSGLVLGGAALGIDMTGVI